MRPLPVNRSHDPLVREFRAFVENTEFPCVGAKASLKKRKLCALKARSITSSWNDLELHREITRFASDYDPCSDEFLSLAVLFQSPDHLTELEFEKVMWQRLQSWTDKDVWKNMAADESVSADPEAADFSLSFGGQAFFAVGLHPGASRQSRRFSHPAIILNLHHQFEKMRANGRYQKLRRTILARDKKLQGSANPMLAIHGESSEARQYSGRKVPPNWKCPFSRKARKDS
ncbi:guanitoxin biosynthesis heme-dependent pre-guanitoxin N-hydroxylase GntA [Parasphingorhabdus sp.]|uniref:guanitoxin biosynthesis heme-dependent pre-guanitoxin N-hydroxylase GntA n=1 Tax=Parasphingorhabdus sp. TaxID=2709688 RepID=UPI003A919A6F